LRLQPADVDAIAEQAEVVFSCLPHAASAEVVKPLVDRGLRVVDFSADYRLDDLQVYQQWYGVEHPDPDRVGKVVYGLPELHRSRLAEAELVANPGCFPTSAILPLAPLLAARLIEPAGLIIDSKTGVSGGGRTPKLPFHFPECNESLAAYGVGQHRHTPEIDQYLSQAAGADVEVLFTPHLAPMDRGILSTCYATPRGEAGAGAMLDALRDYYDDHPFVRVVDHLPATKHVSGTNYCDITVRLARGRAILISCLDNLLKGASGAAVQNFNLMCQLPETTALL
jgi:N-acetyl-gamma-glutamyl-phosphate reductase